jgi:hypothetical protein
MLNLLFVRRQRDESELIMLQKEVLGAVSPIRSTSTENTIVASAKIL